MRILIVTQYYPPSGGSTALATMDMAHAWAQRGHEVTVLTPAPYYPQGRILDGYRGRVAQAQDEQGVRVVRTWLWATASLSLSRRVLSQLSWMLTALPRSLALARPDVVLIEAQPIFAGLLGRIVARLKRAPYVLNISDLWPDHLLTVGRFSENDLLYRIAHELVYSGYRGMAGAATLSPGWTERILKKVPAARNITTIYRGTDIGRFRPDVPAEDLRTRLGLPPGRVAAFLGTFATQYDFDTLLAVFARLRHLPDCVWLIVGTGSQASAIDQRLQTDPELAHVHRVNWIDAEQMPALWALCDITVWSMGTAELYSGTVPAKLFEAFASGTPIVAAHQGVTAALLTETGAGIAVPPGDVEGLARATEQMLMDETTRTTAALRARAYAEAHFDFERVIDAYEALLASVARPDRA